MYEKGMRGYKGDFVENTHTLPSQYSIFLPLWVTVASTFKTSPFPAPFKYCMFSEVVTPTLFFVRWYNKTIAARYSWFSEEEILWRCFERYRRVKSAGRGTSRNDFLCFKKDDPTILYGEASRQNSATFVIPFNRQQLADFLSVDRSAMSNDDIVQSRAAVRCHIGFTEYLTNTNVANDIAVAPFCVYWFTRRSIVYCKK